MAGPLPNEKYCKRCGLLLLPWVDGEGVCDKCSRSAPKESHSSTTGSNGKDTGVAAGVSGSLDSAGPGPGPAPTYAALTKQEHYAKLNPEPIDAIEGWGLNFRLGSVVKYIARAGKKPNQSAVSDLLKALSFLKREISAQQGKPSWD